MGDRLRNGLMGLIVAVAAIGAAIAIRQEPTVRAQETYNYGVVQPFTCRVTAQTVTKECQPLTAGKKAYVTNAIVSNNVGTAQTLKLVTGTGADCVTGTADLTHAVQFGAAVGNQVIGPFPFPNPLQPAAAGLAICVTPSAATSYSATINGFVAP